MKSCRGGVLAAHWADYKSWGPQRYKLEAGAAVTLKSMILLSSNS